jgi:hypothetical protein
MTDKNDSKKMFEKIVRKNCSKKSILSMKKGYKVIFFLTPRLLLLANRPPFEWDVDFCSTFKKIENIDDIELK